MGLGVGGHRLEAQRDGDQRAPSSHHFCADLKRRRALR